MIWSPILSPACEAGDPSPTPSTFKSSKVMPPLVIAFSGPTFMPSEPPARCKPVEASAVCSL